MHVDQGMSCRLAPKPEFHDGTHDSDTGVIRHDTESATIDVYRHIACWIAGDTQSSSTVERCGCTAGAESVRATTHPSQCDPPTMKPTQGMALHGQGDE